MNEQKTAGTLFIVATPLGNLKDMTYRAVETLRHVHLIAAEDTRKTNLVMIVRARIILFNEEENRRRSKITIPF